MSLNLVFDINETLLDTAALNPIFEGLFGQAEVRKEWFLTLEGCWLTDTLEAGRDFRLHEQLQATAPGPR
jgi:2-haloacid dehalogenase